MLLETVEFVTTTLLEVEPIAPPYNIKNETKQQTTKKLTKNRLYIIIYINNLFLYHTFNIRKITTETIFFYHNNNKSIHKQRKIKTQIDMK